MYVASDASDNVCCISAQRRRVVTLELFACKIWKAPTHRVTHDDCVATFHIRGLALEPFTRLCRLGDAALAAQGAKRYVVDETPGLPDRVEMRDLEVGELALLVNCVHLPADTTYHSNHAILVREGATA